MHLREQTHQPDSVYTVYGLSVASDLPLPELAAGTGDADVTIRYGTVPGEPTEADRAQGGCFSADAHEALLYYPTIAKLAVRRGVEIVVAPEEGAEERLVRHLILGVAFGVLLHQRGHLTLHASAVRFGGRAVALVGWKRMGKSTTAAALHAAGHALLTDDTLVFDQAASATVLPGFRTLKLDSDAVTHTLGVAPASLPPLMAGVPRYLHTLDPAEDAEALPLARIFVLAWGPEIRIEPLSLPEAFVELVRHSYAQRFLGSASATASHFRQVEALTREVRVYRLVKPADFARLAEVVQAVEAHLAADEVA